MIPLYGCEAHGGRIIKMDDESVVQDLGVDYEPYILPAAVDAGAGGYARLRRFVQTVAHDGTATIELTPYKDGVESGPTITRSLDYSDPPFVEAPTAVGGTRFSMRIVVAAFNAAVELGKAEFWAVARRTTR